MHTTVFTEAKKVCTSVPLFITIYCMFFEENVSLNRLFFSTIVVILIISY